MFVASSNGFSAVVFVCMCLCVLLSYVCIAHFTVQFCFHHLHVKINFVIRQRTLLPVTEIQLSNGSSTSDSLKLKNVLVSLIFSLKLAYSSLAELPRCSAICECVPELYVLLQYFCITYFYSFFLRFFAISLLYVFKLYVFSYSSKPTLHFL